MMLCYSFTDLGMNSGFIITGKPAFLPIISLRITETTKAYATPALTPAPG